MISPGIIPMAARFQISCLTLTFTVPGFEPGASPVLGKCSAVELHSSMISDTRGKRNLRAKVGSCLSSEQNLLRVGASLW